MLSYFRYAKTVPNLSEKLLKLEMERSAQIFSLPYPEEAKNIMDRMIESRNLLNMNALDRPKRRVMGQNEAAVEGLSKILTEIRQNHAFISAMTRYSSEEPPKPVAGIFWRVLGY
jgi:hypothetical protein